MRAADPAAVAKPHAAYYAFGGLWPLLQLRGFELVLGCKRDHWLVRTIALPLLAVRGGLVASLERESVRREMRLVGLLSALGVGGVAAFYGARRTVSRFHLLDAALPTAPAARWARTLAERTGEHPQARRPDRIAHPGRGRRHEAHRHRPHAAHDRALRRGVLSA